METAKLSRGGENIGQTKTPKQCSEDSIQSCPSARETNKQNLIIWEGILTRKGQELSALHHTPFMDQYGNLHGIN